MRTDDHRGRCVGPLKHAAPLRNQLAITGEHDCFGRLRRDIHRDLPAIIVLKRLSDELSCDGHCRCLLVSSSSLTERRANTTTLVRRKICLNCGEIGWSRTALLLLELKFLD